VAAIEAAGPAGAAKQVDRLADVSFRLLAFAHALR
jgi:hypothetical protein